MTEVTRRHVAHGAAWAVPAIAGAGTAPAVAASGCTPALRLSMGTTYNFGTIYSSSGNTTTQVLQAGGQTYVDNLPAGVTVTSVHYQFWFENRQGQSSTGPGSFWVGNTTSDRKAMCASGTCSGTWTPTSGSGFSTTITSTTNNGSQLYPDGVSRPSWDLNMTWSSTKAPGTYTANGTCQTFTTGPSSRYAITYTGIPALSNADVAAGKESVHSFVTVTATLSDGTTLTQTSQAVLG